jgi:hypothetical protein
MFGFSNIDSNDGLFLEKLFFRVFFASDSVSWLGQMSPNDIRNFPITTSSFLADIVLRFFGIRINQLSVGAEMANIVANIESGGGPNATLPILVYLVNQGDLMASVFFLAFLFFIITFFLRFMIGRCCTPNVGILFAASVFLSPNFIIDLMVYFQYIFWLLIIGLIASIRLRTKILSSNKNDFVRPFENSNGL